MASWDRDDLTLLAQAASDVTALAATIEVVRRRGPEDPAMERAQRLVTRLHATVTQLLEQLKQ